MRQDNALEVARRVLVRVEGGAYAALALSGELTRTQCGDKDKGRALCTELVYGSLRRQTRLDRALCALAPRGLARIDPQVRTLLRLGAYQILFMKVPPPLVVDQVVDVVRRLRGPGLAGFVNALLRRLAREGESPLPPLPGPKASDGQFVAALAEQHGLPPFLVADLLAQNGREQTVALCAAFEAPAALWLRLNLLRGTRSEALLALTREDADLADGQAVPGLPEALRLSSGYPFGGAAYGNGWFTAQDLGAQLVARLLLADTAEGALILPEGAFLDACCGIGGKTTHLSALTQNRHPIDAVDQSVRKLDLCRDHIHRLGCQQVTTLDVDLLNREALQSRLRKSYAAVLLDAPCSGVGVLRRHPEARQRLTQNQVQELKDVQRQLLENLAPHVKPGGVLVYAVCSLLSAEGPEQAAAFLRAHSDFVPLPPADALPWTKYGWPLRTLPHRDDADGFFAIRFRRLR